MEIGKFTGERKAKSASYSTSIEVLLLRRVDVESKLSTEGPECHLGRQSQIIECSKVDKEVTHDFLLDIYLLC